MSKRSMFSLAIVCALSLAGCAHDKLLRLETAEYVVAAKDAQSKGRTFYDDLIRRDREYFSALYQLDTNCTPKSLRESFFLKSGEGEGFCTSEPKRAGSQPLDEVDRALLHRQYAALSFIGNYLDALAKLSADPEFDGKAQFDAAVDDLNTILSATGGKEIPAAESAAVGELIGFIGELSAERGKANEIRKLVAERRDKVDAAFAVLVSMLIKDSVLKDAGIKVEELIGLVSVDEAQGVDPELRRRAMQLHYEAVDERERLDRCMSEASVDPIGRLGLSERDLCASPEAGVMLAAWRSHDEFLDLIDGRLSKKQKARLMKLQRENFIRTVKLYLQFAVLG